MQACSEIVILWMSVEFVYSAQSPETACQAHELMRSCVLFHVHAQHAHAHAHVVHLWSKTREVWKRVVYNKM